jgi:hypothetical protein
VKHGAKAVIVSNHGARQLDHVGATIEALPEVVAAVSGRIPVLIDGGIRRGTDVLKALSIGAKAVCVARPYLYGLTGFGQRGVERVLQILKTELALSMGLAGVANLAVFHRCAARRDDKLRPLDRAAAAGARSNSCPWIEALLGRGSHCRAARRKPGFLLDGKPIAAESPHAGVMFATAKLAPGAHEISLAGGPRVRIHSGGGAPAGWLKFNEHPPGGAACGTCHAVKNGEWAFAKASLVGVCFACHNREAFPKVHTHEPVLSPTARCHSPHGSTTARHQDHARSGCKLCHN